MIYLYILRGLQPNIVKRDKFLWKFMEKIKNKKIMWRQLITVIDLFKVRKKRVFKALSLSPITKMNGEMNVTELWMVLTIFFLFHSSFQWRAFKPSIYYAKKWKEWNRKHSQIKGKGKEFQIGILHPLSLGATITMRSYVHNKSLRIAFTQLVTMLFRWIFFPYVRKSLQVTLQIITWHKIYNRTPFRCFVCVCLCRKTA